VIKTKKGLTPKERNHTEGFKKKYRRKLEERKEDDQNPYN